MKTRYLFIVLALILKVSLFAQDSIPYSGVDTTTVGYKIGQQIGAWLPVIVIIVVLLFYIRSSYRFEQSKKKKD